MMPKKKKNRQKNSGAAISAACRLFSPNSGINLCFIIPYVCAPLTSYKAAIPPLQKHKSELSCVKTHLKPECKH